MVNWQIEPFGKRHDRTGFACGKPSLNQFLARQVTQFAKRNLGVTYVATRPGEDRVVGYVTLATSSLPVAQLPADAAKKLPALPLPTMLIGRLAVDLTARGQRLGNRLLMHGLRQCMTVSTLAGVYAVHVHALDDDAAAFYRKYGFEPLPEQPHHLLLPMADVNALFPDGSPSARR